MHIRRCNHIHATSSHIDAKVADESALHIPHFLSQNININQMIKITGLKSQNLTDNNSIYFQFLITSYTTLSSKRQYYITFAKVKNLKNKVHTQTIF